MTFLIFELLFYIYCALCLMKAPSSRGCNVSKWWKLFLRMIIFGPCLSFKKCL